MTTKRDQKWIDEAIASGPETPLTKKEMDAIRDRVLRDKSEHRQTPAIPAGVCIKRSATD